MTAASGRQWAGRAVLVVLVLAAALVPAGSAQEGATYEVQGVEYYFATGEHGSGHMAFGFDASGARQEAFDGCAWAKLRPDLNRGRVHVMGTYQGLPLTVDLGPFPGADVVPDSMGRDLDVPVGPGTDATVPSLMAATGNATVRIGEVPFVDPVTGNSTMQGTWYVSDAGVRDDETGALAENGGGHEMHLHVSSHPGLPPQGPYTWQESEPKDAPVIRPDESYQHVFTVPNERFTGTAVLGVTATSVAPAGQNQLHVEAYAPNGTRVAAFEIAPAAMADASEEATFSLDQNGAYFVVVTGQAALLQYEVTVEQIPPESFGIDMWWDAVVPGYAGLEARSACDEALSSAIIAGEIAPPADPVPFDWTTSLFTVGAGITLVLVTTAIVLSARAHAAAKQAVHD